MKAPDALRMIYLVCRAGASGFAALLKMKAGTSTRWAAVTRFLP